MELQRRIEERLGEVAGGGVRVTALEPLAGGACQDNFRVETEAESGELAGRRKLVLRSDARRSLPGSLDRQREFAVIQRAVAQGVRTPAARWLTPDLVRPGAHGYFLDWVDGEAIGRRVVRGAELAAARVGLPGELAAELARIHTVTPESAPGLLPDGYGATAVPATTADAIRTSLAFQRLGVSRLPEPHPALTLALLWLEANVPPAEGPVTLVHGDYRTGNFLVGPGGLTGVLDWEFAHFGDPLEDLGWICVRDWRFGEVKQPVGGLTQRAPFYEAYEKASGRRVDPARVHYWEVLGNVKWATGSIFQGERYLSGEETDLELVAIARRACEMEHEALRLIERGPRL
jgi:aminoglycoside phosphotransferase (APT) family kinase protein